MLDITKTFIDFHEEKGFEATKNQSGHYAGFLSWFGDWDMFCREKSVSEDIKQAVEQWFEADSNLVWNDEAKRYENITRDPAFDAVLQFYQNLFNKWGDDSIFDVRRNYTDQSNNDGNIAYIRFFHNLYLFKDHKLKHTALPYWLALHGAFSRIIDAVLIFTTSEEDKSYLNTIKSEIANLLAYYDEKQTVESYTVRWKHGKNAAQLLEKLKTGNYVHSNTSSQDFEKVFSGEKVSISNKIRWTFPNPKKNSGVSIPELIHFLKLAADINYYKNDHRKIIRFFCLYVNGCDTEIQEGTLEESVKSYRERKMEQTALNSICAEFFEPHH